MVPAVVALAALLLSLVNLPFSIGSFIESQNILANPEVGKSAKFRWSHVGILPRHNTSNRISNSTLSVPGSA